MSSKQILLPVLLLSFITQYIHTSQKNQPLIKQNKVNISNP